MANSALTWRAAKHCFAVSMQVADLQPRTRDGYLAYINRFQLWLEERGRDESPATVTRTDVKEFLAAFREGYGVRYDRRAVNGRSPQSLRNCEIALGAFFGCLVREGEIENDPTVTVRLTKVDIEPQPTYVEAEIKRLLLVCPPQSHEGVRNRALVLTLWDTGVRSSELVSMGLPDMQERRVAVRQKHQPGKPATRTVPFGVVTMQAVERYIRRWRIDAAPLWRGQRGSLTTSGLHQLIDRLCREADIECKGVHAFRRGAVAQMKRLGANDSDIAELLGWSPTTALQMIARYSAAHKQELAQKAHQQFGPGDALRA